MPVTILCVSGFPLFSLNDFYFETIFATRIKFCTKPSLIWDYVYTKDVKVAVFILWTTKSKEKEKQQH